MALVADKADIRAADPSEDQRNQKIGSSIFLGAFWTVKAHLFIWLLTPVS